MTRSDERPDWNAVSGENEEVRSYWAQWNSLVINEGVLYRRFHTPDGNTKFLQLIVPASLRQEFVRQAHGGVTGGHFGIRRSQDQVMRRGYWVGWRRFVERFCKQCPVCNQVHRGEPPKQGQLKPMLSNGPMDRLHIDLCGKFSRSDGNAWILTCVDAYTRFLIAVPIRDKSARTVAEALMNHVFGIWGMSRQLVSDLGPEFQNDILKQLCSLLHVHQLRTTSYRPNANGKVERVHRSLNSLMAKVVSDNQKDWSSVLPLCVLAYNMSKSEATSFSPYYLMHGREAICPLDLLLDTPREDYPVDLNDFADQLVERLKSAFRIVAEHTKTQIQRMKRNYDTRVKPKAFQLNDLVWYYYPRRLQGRSAKWSRFYTGPYRITSVLNDVNFVLKKSPRSKAIIAHIDKLRTYFGPVPACWESTTTPNCAAVNHDVPTASSEYPVIIPQETTPSTREGIISNDEPNQEPTVVNRRRSTRTRRPPHRFSW